MIPVPSHPAITTPYGKTGSWSGGVHGGADFGSNGIGGATVVAPWRGTVIGVRNEYGGHGTTWGSAYGYHVVIDYDPLPDGSSGLYGNVAHLKDVAVTVGQRVEAGQVIGHVNSTGNSTGDHAHAEIQRTAGWQSGGHLNPQPWFNATTEEDDMTPEQAEDLSECRRMLGVLTGWNAPQGPEQTIAQQTLAAPLLENTAESRRQGGVILAAIPPGHGEKTIPEQLRET
jgi:murein DD-endopeptidase MepM/ murein hydrolase activator NlpD